MWTLFRPCAKKRYRSDSVIYLLEAQYSVSLFLRKSYIRFYFDLCFGRMANKQITLILLICSVGKFRLKLKWAHPGKIDLLIFFFRWLCCILKKELALISVNINVELQLFKHLLIVHEQRAVNSFNLCFRYVPFTSLLFRESNIHLLKNIRRWNSTVQHLRLLEILKKIAQTSLVCEETTICFVCMWESFRPFTLKNSLELTKEICIFQYFDLIYPVVGS